MELALANQDGSSIVRFFKTHSDIDAFAFGRTLFGQSVASKWTSSATFESFQPGLESLLTMYKEPNGDWLSSIVALYFSRLRVLAQRNPVHLHHLKTTLDSTYRFISLTAKQQQFRNLSLDVFLYLFIVVEQMKINALSKSDSMTRNLIKNVVEQPTFPPFESFTLRDKIEYYFFVGRSRVLEDNIHDAIAPLSFCLAHLRRNGKFRNRVLAYWLPAQIALGKRPRLLHGGGGPVLNSFYSALVQYLALGKAREFVNILEANQTALCKLGTFSLWLKCKRIAQRNLFRLCVKAYKAEHPGWEGKQLQLPLLFPIVLRHDAVGSPAEEIEAYTYCLVANLIASGFIKGYISFEHKVVVLSVKNTFPQTTLVTSI